MNNKLKNIVPVAVFLLFTFAASTMFFALPKESYSSHEKRYLADTPEFSFENLISGELIKEIDGDSENNKSGYVADHFPFRTFFMGINSYYNLALRNTADNGYYYGRDGYIITKPYSTDNLTSNINSVNKFAQHNGNTVLAIVPSAGYILSDKLPLNHVSYPDEGVFTEIATSANTSVEFVNLTDTMKDLNAKGTPAYYRTDHHWTTPAAYEAYCALGANLGYTPLKESEFNKISHNGFYGTTYSSSGYFLEKPDSIEIWENPDLKNITVEIHNGENIRTYDTLYFEEHLSADDMYPVFLNGNQPKVVIKNADCDGGRLFVAKDSYAHALVPFLVNHYSEIVMIDTRYYKQVTSLLEETEFTDMLVLFSINNFCIDKDLAFLGIDY